ncbi:hypothetical protein K469DRAFT_685958 [Zopfia rhizophila CBS 207.26]|uniref:Uncharacterized protein n=1 Tax=Zopfia rhizophila CBS 207.26 TaxID=1314779 RepID=A0A6A6E9M5_9PEZI|nr:hypothetical protein K469DRAFT_685958 [Zopfia rhizophila CBS 207.26]
MDFDNQCLGFRVIDGNEIPLESVTNQVLPKHAGETKGVSIFQNKSAIDSSNNTGVRCSSLPNCATRPEGPGFTIDYAGSLIRFMQLYDFWFDCHAIQGTSISTSIFPSTSLLGRPNILVQSRDTSIGMLVDMMRAEVDPAVFKYLKSAGLKIECSPFADSAKSTITGCSYG